MMTALDILGGNLNQFVDMPFDFGLSQPIYPLAFQDIDQVEPDY